MIRNRQLEKDACRDCRVPGDRSVFFILTGSRKRLCRVLPMILRAAIPVGAARKRGLPLSAAIELALGLKIVSAKGPVEVLVIDHVEKAIEN